MSIPAVRSAQKLSSPSPTPNKADAFIQAAMHYLGTPYLWGGGHGGDQHLGGRVDCSGLVSQAGYAIGEPRLAGTADAQQAMARPIDKSQLQPGDLCFVGHPAEHVGIYIGNGKVLQAPHTGANVDICSVDAFDNFGRIFSHSGKALDLSQLPASAFSADGGSPGGVDSSRVGGGGSPSGLALPASGGAPAPTYGGAGATAPVRYVNPYADFPPDLVSALLALGHPPDPRKLAELAARYHIAMNRLLGFCTQGPLPTDLVVGAHGGECGAWMMAERGKMGLPTWDFAMAKDLMWNYPHDKVELVKTPKVGDAFIMTTGEYGHTGFVKSVNGDGTVTVMDSNWAFDEKERVHKIPMSAIAGYLQDKG